LSNRKFEIFGATYPDRASRFKSEQRKIKDLFYCGSVNRFAVSSYVPIALRKHNTKAVNNEASQSMAADEIG
jgi:hypothetical protein